MLSTKNTSGEQKLCFSSYYFKQMENEKGERSKKTGLGLPGGQITIRRSTRAASTRWESYMAAFNVDEHP